VKPQAPGPSRRRSASTYALGCGRDGAERERPGADNHDQRAYFHSQDLFFVFPSASALYSKTTAMVFRRRKFGESL